jgi:hypothetical protein
MSYKEISWTEAKKRFGSNYEKWEARGIRNADCNAPAHEVLEAFDEQLKMAGVGLRVVVIDTQGDSFAWFLEPTDEV